MRATRVLITIAALVSVASVRLLANGGAEQTGVPETGNGAASDHKRVTEVTIEEESLKIDLHQEFAAVEVHYRMKNTGPSISQDFFFPVELWMENDNKKVTDLEGYRIAVDGAELDVQTVESEEKPKPVVDKLWGQFHASVRIWKKSQIPFERGQIREVFIRYRAGYSVIQSFVSDDSHYSDALFHYSLSPAATWKGPIGKGKITVNILHARPEEVTISKPKDRFKKVTATQFVWDFRDLRPTLADNIRIVVHPAYESYPNYDLMSERERFWANYVIQGNHYFLTHTDYDAVASSTLSPSGGQNYSVENIKGLERNTTWAEGVDGDGVGEVITLTLSSNRTLPLDAILIEPGYRSDDQRLWEENNRVAALEVTLNGEHTFLATIPDEKFRAPYPIPVRNYSKAVKSVKLEIKGVYRGSAVRDTCISAISLQARLSKKPSIRPAR